MLQPTGQSMCLINASNAGHGALFPRWQIAVLIRLLLYELLY